MATLTVRLDGTAAYTSVRTAVLAAVAGDTIQVTQAGAYVETAGGIAVPANTITIKGTVDGVVVRFVASTASIDCSLRTGTTLERLTLEGTATSASPLVLAGPTTTVRRVRFLAPATYVGLSWSAVSLGNSLVDRCSFVAARADVAPATFLAVSGAIGTGPMTLDVRASVFEGKLKTATTGRAIDIAPAISHGDGMMVTIDNVTVSGVHTGYGVTDRGVVRLRNSVYANPPSGAGAVAVLDNTTAWLKDNAVYCCFEGTSLTGYPASNIAKDPLFVAEDRGDFRLAAASPCRNAGADLSADFTLDRDGNAFGLGRAALEGEATWDIGAYDSQLLGDYVTLRDLQESKGKKWLTDVTDDAATDTLDAAVAGAAARKAEGLVNGYLAARYATPLDLTGIPQAAVQQVRHWVTCLAVYLLAVRRDRTDANVVEDHRHCLEELQAIRDGKLALGGATPAAGSLVLHNHTTDGTEPFFTITRTARGGADIDKNEVGSLDKF